MPYPYLPPGEQVRGESGVGVVVEGAVGHGAGGTTVHVCACSVGMWSWGEGWRGTPARSACGGGSGGRDERVPAQTPHLTPPTHPPTICCGRGSPRPAAGPGSPRRSARATRGCRLRTQTPDGQPSRPAVDGCTNSGLLVHIGGAAVGTAKLLVVGPHTLQGWCASREWLVHVGGAAVGIAKLLAVCPHALQQGCTSVGGGVGPARACQQRGSAGTAESK